MNQKRSVVVGGALSALLIGASSAFAIGSGLFGGGAADNVGTFQSIEQAAVSRVTPPTALRSPTRPNPSTSRYAASPTGPSSHDDDDSAQVTTAPAIGSTAPATESHDSEPPTEGYDDDEAYSPTTSTTQPEHEEEPDDDGHESDGHEIDDGRESDD